MYEEIQELRKERDSYITTVQKLDKKIDTLILEYRIESVKRVLDHINDLCWKKQTDVDQILIVHCLNKLNGNLDGVELNLLKEDNHERTD